MLNCHFELLAFSLKVLIIIVILDITYYINNTIYIFFTNNYVGL